MDARFRERLVGAADKIFDIAVVERLERGRHVRFQKGGEDIIQPTGVIGMGVAEVNIQLARLQRTGQAVQSAARIEQHAGLG